MRIPNLLCFLFALTYSSGQAQIVRDTTFLASSENAVKNFYLASLSSQSSLYTGSDYPEYVSQNDEHPFYLGDDWQIGSISYNGFVYDNIALQFDIQNQKLVTEHLASKKKIQLIGEKTDSFTISNHRFVRLDRKTLSNSGETPGFYDLLADGPTQLYAKRIKTYKQEVVSGKFESKFDETTKYYLLKDQQFLQVKGKSSALKILADKKGSLSQELKKKKISFRRERENALIETVKTYNKLKD